MCHMPVETTGPGRTDSSQSAKIKTLKYLILAAVLSLLFLLIYARLRPYLQMAQKLFRTLDAAAEPRPVSNPSKAAEHKLIRCVSCGTWVPTGRAISLGSEREFYCSRDCVEKRAKTRPRKVAG